MKKTPIFPLLLALTGCAFFPVKSWGTDLEIFEGSRKWQFLPGSEFPPGGSGGFSNVTEDGKDLGVLEYDFSSGGAYVAIETYLSIPGGFSDLRFKAKSEAPRKLGVRLVDAAGETFQYSLTYNESGEWQEFSIDLAGKPSNHWGPNADGVIQYPVKQLIFLVERDKVEPVGSVQFAEVKLLK